MAKIDEVLHFGKVRSVFYQKFKHWFHHDSLITFDEVFNETYVRCRSPKKNLGSNIYRAFLLEFRSTYRIMFFRESKRSGRGFRKLSYDLYQSYDPDDGDSPPPEYEDVMQRLADTFDEDGMNFYQEKLADLRGKAGLSDGEYSVLSSLLLGYIGTEIAGASNMSPQAVSSYRARGISKLKRLHISNQ